MYVSTPRVCAAPASVLCRAAYLPLYKKKLKAPWLPAATEVDMARLADLERRLPLEDTLAFRHYAEQQLRVEGRTEAARSARRGKKEAESAGNSGWFGWMGGGPCFLFYFFWFIIIF
jgi:hypothetical protein